VCAACGGVSNRAYLQAPAVNDSESASHVVIPEAKKWASRQVRAQNAWKGTKDPKKRKELKEAAADLQRHKS
jgi:hypothetical protein